MIISYDDLWANGYESQWWLCGEVTIIYVFAAATGAKLVFVSKAIVLLLGL